jgi:hypothetical protein
MKKMLQLIFGLSLVVLGLLVLAKTAEVVPKETAEMQEPTARLLFNPLFTHVGLMRGVE